MKKYKEKILIKNADIFRIDARTLWAQLGKPQGDFSNWSKRKIVEKNWFEENKDYISNWYKDKVKYDESGDLDINNTNQMVRNGYCKEYILTLDCSILICQRSKNNPNNADVLRYLYSLKDNNVQVIVKESKRFEDEFMDKLEQSLQPLGYSLERQKSMFNGKYRIDGYIEELKLAIEYDEEQHNIYNNKILDEQRQQDIENELGCTFVRLDYKDTDAYNIGVVMKYIIHNKAA